MFNIRFKYFFLLDRVYFWCFFFLCWESLALFNTWPGERSFKCTWEGCNAAYITCGGLASHMLSHSNDQHFCCEFCGKTFKHKLSYHSHLRRHTGMFVKENVVDLSDVVFTDLGDCVPFTASSLLDLFFYAFFGFLYLLLFSSSWSC